MHLHSERSISKAGLAVLYVLFSIFSLPATYGADNVQITIVPKTRYQTMVGFGGALTWHSSGIWKGRTATQKEIIQLLFVDSGMDVLRLKNWYYPAGYPKHTAPSDIKGGDKNNFNSTKKIYYAAKAANPHIQVLLSSWSPPEFLKSNGKRKNGGTLARDGDGYRYDELARYWSDCLDNLGWAPDYLSFQNEPGWKAKWDSCIFSATETDSKAGYSEAVDAIWNAIKDRKNVPRMIGTEAENMKSFLKLTSPLRDKKYISAYAYHNYNLGKESKIDSVVGTLRKISKEYGDRPNWMTEFSKSNLDWIATARIIHNTVVEGNASAYIYWALVWKAGSEAMIDLDNKGNYIVQPPFYTLKHFAKFVNKGYQRIEVKSSNTNIKVSGYLSDKKTSITLVAINKGKTSKQIDLIRDSFSCTGISGHQSVAGKYWQTMPGLDVANPIALPAESITTVVLTLSKPLFETSFP